MVDDMRAESPDTLDGVRELARKGILADTYAQASPDERRRLRREAYELLHPVVFGNLTRRVEARRGHPDCTSITTLRPDCLDHFHDDMDAVLDDLFRNARVPINNLEGWVCLRLVPATVDGYRRRRGDRGALQRPRIPRWLARALDHDARLLGLAIDMLEWVGVEATAGADDWPVQTWAARRVAMVGDYDAACREVMRDITTVISAMRTNPRWYGDYVERPMGRKPLPVAHQDTTGQAADRPRTALEAGAADDARRTELAALAVAAIVDSVQRGADVRTAIVEVISMLFGSGTAADTLDRLPGDDDSDHDFVLARLAEPGTVDRILSVVLDLLGR